MRQHEGKVGRIVRQDESEGSIDFRSISSEFVHPDKLGRITIKCLARRFPSVLCATSTGKPTGNGREDR